MLFIFGIEVPLMCHLLLPLMNSFNKTEAAYFHMQDMFPQ